jgi:hypothetical protein
MMSIFRRAAAIGSVLVALLAVSMTWKSIHNTEKNSILIRGNNDDVLFLALAESGQINVQLATAQAMMENYPDIKIHFASFPHVAEKVARVSSFARRKNPAAKTIEFHTLPGRDRIEAMMQNLHCQGALECLAHPPGARGAGILAQQLEFALWAWSGEEHLAIYHRTIEIIKHVDPAVVVVDFAFRPAVDATKKLNRLHAIISPLALADIFAPLQPYGSATWKYPALVHSFKSALHFG